MDFHPRRSARSITTPPSPEPESEMSSSTFRDFLTLGAGVTLPKEA
jgi:hypothetical protein